MTMNILVSNLSLSFLSILTIEKSNCSKDMREENAIIVMKLALAFIKPNETKNYRCEINNFINSLNKLSIFKVTEIV